MRLAPAVSMIALLAFATPAFADEYVIMKVNNQDVTSAEAKGFWEGLYPSGQAPAFDTLKPDVRDKVLRGLMAEKLLFADAVAHGTDKSEAVQRQLEEMRRKLIVRTYLDTKTSDISEADLKKEYDSIAATNKDEKEWKISQILVDNEQQAKDVKKKIDEGKSFETVARESSKDAGSATQGGDLGYFTKDKLAQVFANDGVSQLKKGEVSGPVHSSFGWHIIKVEDIRKAPVPAFSEVKDALRARIQEKRLNEFVGGLVKTADVKVFDAKGKEIPFDKNLPTAPKPADGKTAPAAASAAPAPTPKPAAH